MEWIDVAELRLGGIETIFECDRITDGRYYATHTSVSSTFHFKRRTCFRAYYAADREHATRRKGGISAKTEMVSTPQKKGPARTRIAEDMIRRGRKTEE